MKRTQTATTLQRKLDQAQALCAAGRHQEALDLAAKLEQAHGRRTEVSYWRAAACMGMQDSRQAAQIIEAALQADPDHAPLLALAGVVALHNGDLGRAKALLERCVAIAPTLINGWINYAAVLTAMREHSAARDAALKAMALDPREAAAVSNYASALKDTGDMDAAIVAMRQAAALAPENVGIRTNLLFGMLFDQNTTAMDLLREAKAYARLTTPPRSSRSAQAFRTRTDGGPIRLGLLSNDLLRHACAYYILPLIANLDRTRVEVVALSLNPASDPVTDKIRAQSNRFVALAGMSRTEIMRVIRDEELDVLVDLGGHTGTSPLQYMAHGLAPVQMTWLGYPGSTGLDAIQYRVTDWHSDPAGFESHYTESLLRAPGAFCAYAPLVHNPLGAYDAKYAVQETPALRNGHITFGSCNNLAKLTDKTLRLWSAVLARCEGSRLLVEARELDHEAVRQPLLARMARAGIDPGRVSCVPLQTSRQYLTYNDIDIVLDTTPLTGGTTTCDALWMGVPVVSLAGQAYHARISAPFLHAAGLEGLVCGSEEDYVAAAASLAADVGQLNALRLGLRQRFEQGPAMDGAAFAGWLESELVEIVGRQRPLDLPAERRTNGVFYADAWHSMADIMLGIVSLLAQGNDAAVRNLLENISAKWSRHWLVACVLAELAHRSGDTAASITLLMETIALRKYHLPLYRLLSARLQESGHDAQALAGFLQQEFGISLDYLDQQPVPSLPELLGIEAAVLPIATVPQPARDPKTLKASQAMPKTTPKLLKQAETCFFAGQLDETLQIAEQARRQSPQLPEPYYWLALANLELHHNALAHTLVQQGLAAAPDNPDLMALCGRILLKLGRADDARAQLEACVALHPASLAGWANLAIVLRTLGLHAQALQASLRALEFAPDNPAVLSNYANDLKDTGNAEQAIATLRKAARLAPENHSIRSNLLFMMLFGEDTAAADLLAEASDYARLLGSVAMPDTGSRQAASPGQKIRLGVLSNDLYRHACAYFLVPFLANLDRARFEIVALGLHPFRDSVTLKIEMYTDRFVQLANRSAADVVRAVRDENLDVLIDLGGYTGTSPLQYMVHGLAPVQMTWLGYPGSTGMPAIQHRITDGVADPAGFEPHYTENLLRAPGVFAAYQPLVFDPLRAYQPQYQVRETPALANGYITFGSCNNLGKLTDRTLRLWSAVLARVPGSRLLIEAAELDQDSVSGPLLQRMVLADIDPARVTCIPRLGQNQYLTYHDIDISLDTSPVTGGTTTCDTLWMGVPVVSLAGPAFHTRVSAPFLHAVGLGGLVCDSEDGYVEAAAQLAGDIAQLNALRLSLRHRFEKSAAFDAAGFTRWFEAETVALVQQHRDLSHLVARTQDGVFCKGAWHSMEELVLTISLLLEEGRHIELNSLLENMSSKWSKHWLVAFALGEMEQRVGNYDRALELLMESINLRPYHLPLYRLLNARMAERGHDRSWLAELLNQQFGLELALLEGQGKPTTHDILGIQVLEDAA
ncbi:TPR domain protein, putative component of TonB system (modular protein) (plasmid) [Cupriavidus taiwanensis]|uniref:protein O-GlcNAc transferase n=1 Tax=Cupriavidus taiwanensis TaxID=164546 RepID=A0A9Q7XVQ3_9BURK|nr:tetratricopeptide repeat protein [Cupriavidus taiwanensis]SPD68909.1 TPR domain protein, putative component of TonB system (modular protein) [Cupriavidus taiwanensis]